ncbi:hypothetical protein TRVL_00246 [Trypanosoma vivax]|nr:hypothetical protein TRVL_00246 [Trypanosoma vivax]
MSQRSPRRKVQLLSDGERDGAGNGTTGNINGASSPRAKDQTKSLYLTVSTGRAFPYVAKWIHDKSSEMENATTKLEKDCDGSILQEVWYSHRSVHAAREHNEKSRLRLMDSLQMLLSVLQHQSSAGEVWLDSFKEAAAAHVAELRNAYEQLLERRRLADGWTLGGGREAVVGKLERLDARQAALLEHSERSTARENIRREQTLRNMRMAMERLVGEVGDAVIWDMHQRTHGNPTSVLRGSRPLFGPSSATSVLDDELWLAEPCEERKLREEGDKLDSQLREMRRKRALKNRVWRSKKGHQGQDGKGQSECTTEGESASEHHQTLSLRSPTPLRVSLSVGSAGRVSPQSMSPTEAANVCTPGGRSAVQLLASAQNKKPASGARFVEGSSSTTTDKSKAPIAELEAGPGKSRGLLLPLIRPLSSQAYAKPSGSKDMHAGGAKSKGSSGETAKLSEPELPVADGCQRGGTGSVSKSTTHHVTSSANERIRSTGARRVGAAHRTVMRVSRPPITLPPNAASRSANGQYNADQLAALLSVLSEEKDHFESSRGKIQGEVLELRRKLRGQREETERLMQLNISLETQRTQLLVHRDAQLMKLATCNEVRQSESELREVDMKLLNAELGRTLDLLKKRLEERCEEIRQVQAASARSKKRFLNETGCCALCESIGAATPWQCDCRSSPASLRRTRGTGVERVALPIYTLPRGGITSIAVVHLKSLRHQRCRPVVREPPSASAALPHPVCCRRTPGTTHTAYLYWGCMGPKPYLSS